jgi:dihydrofolate reductase
MRKVILNMNMTFDGFFNLDWMGRMHVPDQELNDDTMALMGGTDGGFVGYPFASGMIPYWLNVAKNPSASQGERAIAHAVNNAHKIVISSSEEKLEWENSELLLVQGDNDLVEAVTKLKQQPGRDLGVIGGIRTAQTFARLGFIDEYNLLVHPVAIGNGTRVFTDRADLKLVSVKTYNSGVMRVCYRPAQ